MDWTETFKVLSDDTRLRILNLLFQLELNVDEMMQIMDMQQSRVSKHLKILKERIWCMNAPTALTVIIRPTKKTWGQKCFRF